MLLVTGITGHTGGYFIKELVENKYKGKIRCIVRSTSDTKTLENSGLDIEIIIGDINNNELVETIMNNVKTVLHIYNIHQSTSILKSAIKNKVNKVILVHTTGVYSQFKSASLQYNLIEKEIDQISSAEKYKTNITILRPTMIYGDLCDRNISKFIKMVDKLKFIPVINGGKSLIQPVNARDLGKAYYSVLMNEDKTSNKSYILSGEKPITLIEVLRLISIELNRKVMFISIPLKPGIILARLAKVLSLGKVDIVEKIQRMGEDRSFPHDEAFRDFGYSPIKFDRGLNIEVKQYLNKRR